MSVSRDHCDLPCVIPNDLVVCMQHMMERLQIFVNAKLVVCTYWLRRQLVRGFILSRRVSLELVRNERNLWRAGFLVLVIITVVASAKYVSYPLIARDRVDTFFFSLGAMAGTILAIIFSLALFVQQRAADMYSSGLFASLSHNRFDRFVYFFISALIVTFFTAGSLVDSPSVLPDYLYNSAIYAAFLLLGILFVLIDLFYERTLQRIDPRHGLVHIAKTARKLLKSYKKDAKRAAWAIAPAKDKSKNEKLTLAAAFAGHAHYLEILDKQLEVTVFV